jgi:hypothetical protein
MIHVFQTKFGRDRGNCLQACIASVLEMDIDKIPDFQSSESGWFRALIDWCEEYDLGLLFLKNTSDSSLLINCYPILTFTVSGEEEEHAVVGKTTVIYNEKTKLMEWEASLYHNPNKDLDSHRLIELTGILIIFKKG